MLSENKAICLPQSNKSQSHGKTFVEKSGHRCYEDNTITVPLFLLCQNKLKKISVLFFMYS